MSGSGRKSHYRKSVQDKFLHGFPIPEENDFICKAISSRGTNIFEVLLLFDTFYILKTFQSFSLSFHLF